jgi:hypothetical protein
MSKNKKIGEYLNWNNRLLKVVASENARNVGTVCTERVGGQGYLVANRISELISFG